MPVFIRKKDAGLRIASGPEKKICVSIYYIYRDEKIIEIISIIFEPLREIFILKHE